MKKLGPSLITLIMLLAFMPFNLEEGPGMEKITVAAAETINKKYIRDEIQSVKDTYHQMSRGQVFASAGGLFVFVLLIIAYIWH
jgi:hypothetical protein